MLPFSPVEWFHFKFWKYGMWVECLKWLLLLGLFTLQEYQQYPSRQPPVIDPGLILYCLFGGRFRLIDWLICIVYLMHCTYLIIIRNCISWYTDVYKIVYRILSILTVRPAVNLLILMDKEFQKVVILTLTKMIGVNDFITYDTAEDCAPSPHYGPTTLQDARWYECWYICGIYLVTEPRR